MLRHLVVYRIAVRRAVLLLPALPNAFGTPRLETQAWRMIWSRGSMIWKMPRLRWNPRYTQRRNVYVYSFFRGSHFDLKEAPNPPSAISHHSCFQKRGRVHDTSARDRGCVLLQCHIGQGFSQNRSPSEWVDRLLHDYHYVL